MSKSSTASTPKISSQLSQKSAWAKGPPQTTSTAPSPRSQSPAPNANGPTAPTHSRRPSTLGQGVSFKDGVAGARSPTVSTKTGMADIRNRHPFTLLTHSRFIGDLWLNRRRFRTHPGLFCASAKYQIRNCKVIWQCSSKCSCHKWHSRTIRTQS